MPIDETELASVREANQPYHAGYERRLAAEIVAMLPQARDEALRILMVVDVILSLPVAPSEPRPVPDAS
jgi:hypothetical protein